VKGEEAKDLLTVTEAAEELGISVSAVQVRLRRGQMRGIRPSPRIWLVPRSEVDAWRERGKMKPGRPPKPGGEAALAEHRQAHADHDAALEAARERIRGERHDEAVGEVRRRSDGGQPE
jgi:excisionase family DNA binding protein